MAEKVSDFNIQLHQREGYRFEAVLDKAHYPTIPFDEPPPLGQDSAPSAARLLAAAIGNCLSASLVFCASRKKTKLEGVKTDVNVEIVRNESRRLRIGKVTAQIHVPSDVDPAMLAECLEIFEDFCTVTASIRKGIEVDVSVVAGE